MRRHSSTIAIALLLGPALMAADARAQWGYPRGYGNYGMSQWGANPAAGYMAGLGAYARGQGVYAVDQAKANAINAETMLKWNKALRARQAALRQEEARQAAEAEVQAAARLAQQDLVDGTTLNNLLLQVLSADPSAARAGRAKAPLGAAAIREIPFEWDTEAITLCVDQMTGQGGLPKALAGPAFVAERDALRAAVGQAIKEDVRSNVSPEARKRVVDAVAAFRAKFVKEVPDLDPGYMEADEYLTTLAGLTRLLNDPSMKQFLAQLDDGQGRTVGDLIAFMNAYNLRFGAATSDAQVALYRRLVPILAAVRDEATGARPTSLDPDRSGANLRAAARDAFKGMSWDDLSAHAR